MRVLITGATGMIGSSVLQTHLRIAECTEIIVLTRRSTAMNDPKLTEVIIHDFLNLELDTNLLQNIDVVHIQEPFLLISFVKSMSTIPECWQKH